MKVLTKRGLAVLRSADREGKFKATCAVLSEIRDRRLYHNEFADFDSYVKSRFSTIDEVAGRVGFTINELVDFGCQLTGEDN